MKLVFIDQERPALAYQSLLVNNFHTQAFRNGISLASAAPEPGLYFMESPSHVSLLEIV